MYDVFICLSINTSLKKAKRIEYVIIIVEIITKFKPDLAGILGKKKIRVLTIDKNNVMYNPYFPLFSLISNSDIIPRIT